MRRIPVGRVATYGQIAYIIGQPKSARQIGWALASLRNRTTSVPVPWQRVVNAKGKAMVGSEQVILLEEEGIMFNDDGQIDLEVFGWNGL